MKTKVLSLIPITGWAKHQGSPNDGGIPLQARALAWCMDISGMEALFTRADLQEMLIRVIAAVPELKAEENYFSHGCLFSFSWDGLPYRLYPEDITAFLGLHLWDLPLNNFDRDKWLNNLSANRFSAWLSCHPFGPALKPVNTGEDREDESDYTPGEKELDAAGRLVDFIMGRIPDEVFDRFESDNEIELKEIRLLVEKANSPLPIRFDWNALPEETQQAFTRHILKDDHREGISMEEIRKDWSHVEDLAHLVWARNNGLIFHMDSLQIDPRWDVNIEKFDALGHDFGLDFPATWKAFRLDEVAHLIQREMPEAELWKWAKSGENVFETDLDEQEEEHPSENNSSINKTNHRNQEKERIRMRKKRLQACLSQAEINAFTGPVSELRIPVYYHLQNRN
jgi:hypothetical protein